MTRLERNAKMVEALWHLRKAYRSGDFSEFVSCLSEDCVYESMWVLEPLRGKEAVSNHLLRKGKAIKDSGAFPECWIVELVGNMNPLPESDIVVNGEKKRATLALDYEPGKYCMMMEQELDGKINGVLLDLKLNEDGMVTRIDLCIPELFQTRELAPFIRLLPSNSDEIDDEEDAGDCEAMVYVGEAYFGELQTFFHVVGEAFDEYEDLVIPMEQWRKVLASWEEFVQASDYDTIAEKLCGIDYTTWTVTNITAHDQLNWCGKRIWDNRNLNSVLLRDLREWTEKYRDKYNFIRSYGY